MCNLLFHQINALKAASQLLSSNPPQEFEEGSEVSEYLSFDIKRDYDANPGLKVHTSDDQDTEVDCSWTSPARTRLDYATPETSPRSSMETFESKKSARFVTDRPLVEVADSEVGSNVGEDPTVAQLGEMYHGLLSSKNIVSEMEVKTVTLPQTDKKKPQVFVGNDEDSCIESVFPRPNCGLGDWNIGRM